MSKAPEIVVNLVKRFGDHIDAYKSGGYNETQLRQEFLNPFFEALGWDVYNKKGYAEPYKDVIHEDAISVGAATKAPDYCFRIGGARKFFVEAKKPSVNLKDDISPAFQLRRYAWSSKLPLSILTDFEEFAVYECATKPQKTDRASKGRVLYLRYDEYPGRWDEIHSVFSRDAILKGSFDKYAASRKLKRGTAEVDDEFLKEIENWRELLARNIALRNPSLSQRELNYAVQQTIDRIVFLRIAEDREIENYGRLQALLNGANCYRRMVQLFREADDRYNSGLFHFTKEKGRTSQPDELTPGLAVDDKALKDILKRLYYPESPYEFSVIPADILGQAYERFLGRVIRLTRGHYAKVEDKPEVRKAGGVYYTPTYIVDYIVGNTVGRLLEGKTPKEALKLRIVDPACGSGSFLIGAYQCLLDWHRDWYAGNDPDKWARGKAPALYQAQGGEWRLTTAEKKRILLNNIYGVDIDPQAVEVSKLSLLLKVLEGESGQTLRAQLKMFQERALPDLASNIKCGNSLIGPDFYKEKDLALFDEEEQYRINAFDWQREFKDIMKAGGFDAVIGNPPYGAYFGNDEKQYIKSNFLSYKSRYDSYIYFIEKAILLSKMNGYVSFITPEVWLKLEMAYPLRKFIFEKAGLSIIKVYGEKVFRDVTVNVIVFVVNKNSSINMTEIFWGDNSWKLEKEAWSKTDMLSIDYRLTTEARNIINRMLSGNIGKLGDFGEIIQGITAYDKYRGQKADIIKNRAYHFDYCHDNTCGRWLAGKDISRYHLAWSGEWLKYGPWLAAPRDQRFFQGKRIIFREVPGKGKRIQATIVEDIYYHGHSITPFKALDNININYEYILGLVNSSLISWYGSLLLPNFGKSTFPKLNPTDIKLLPIRTIDFSDPEEKKMHGRLVSLVERMLELNGMLPGAKTAHEQTALRRQIENIDRQIDNLVYKLYGLTEEEIRVVEGNT